MAPIRFLLTVSLALLHASFDALPVNALAVEHGGRGLAHAHADIAMKRDSSKKCRPRPTSASASPVAATPHSVPSSTSSQPAPTSTNTGSGPSGGNSKILLGFSNNEQQSLKNFVGNMNDRPLIYNWKLTKYTNDDIGASKAIFETMEFVPTAHSAADAANIPNVLTPGYAKYCKGYNEPELGTQGNVPVQQGHDLWKQYFVPLVHQGYQLIAPAVTMGDAGFTWLQTFLQLCDGQCQLSYLDAHFYSVEGSDFPTAMNKFHDAFGMQWWLSEVGCHDYSGKNVYCTQELFDSFYPAVMSFVESSSFIEKVAWYGFFTTSEININPVNSFISCPNGAGADCNPTKQGTAFLNGESSIAN